MQQRDTVKPFFCQIHQSEVIQRVCVESTSENALRCIECILGTGSKTSKESLLPFKDFLDYATRHYQTLRTISRFEEAAPANLVELLSTEDTSVQKFAKHIEQEKQKVDESFHSILQQFSLICHAKKEELCRELDRQLVTFRLNHSYLKSKIDRYYDKSKEDELNPDKQTLVQRLNNCQDAVEAEVVVKNINDDIAEASAHGNSENKAKDIKEGLNQLAKELKEQSQCFVKSSFSTDAAVEESLKKLRDAFDPVFEELIKLQDPVSEFSLTNSLFLDSKIIKKASDANLLKSWISPSGQVRLKLLYRGSRDGYNAQKFHKLCDKHASTLTIAKSNHGRVFGGYSDMTWEVTNNYKQSTKTWLFSIDEKQKYPVKKDTNNAYATYTNANYGPTFGSGHDLCISLSNGTTGSYSNVNNAYKGPNDTSKNQTVLAGAYQFTCEELEVYAVNAKPSASDDAVELDSVILDPKKDISTIKKWLNTQKTPELELLYRGTKDGFEAANFHNACDDQGPTLVVCKSEGYEKVFGGYTSQNWNQSESYTSDNSAFLFSLTNNTKHAIISPECAIFGSWESGPVFGAGYDLLISANSNILEQSSSQLGTTYAASDECGDLSSYLSGSTSFMLSEIEVFKVNI